MIEIIKEHLTRYPLMESGDVFKLIYQSVYGGGHMIANPAVSLGRIKSEYIEMVSHMIKEESKFFSKEDTGYITTTESDTQNDMDSESITNYKMYYPSVENIGGNMCRIYLRALREGLTPETLNKMFVLSAYEKHGRAEELERELESFLHVCEAGELPFDSLSISRNWDVWRATEYPAVSHTKKYRDTYHPAYRVVSGKYGKYYEVILTIDRLMTERINDDRSIVIAIDGMAGSGKSTLGTLLQSIYDCNLFHMDDFFLQPHQRTEERLSQPGGNVDYERFQTEILNQIDAKEDFSYQIFDCGEMKLGRLIDVKYKKLNIIEGAYSGHPYFNHRADLLFFKEISQEEQIKRVAGRNGNQILLRFLQEWIPMEEEYFDTFGIREKAIMIKE